LRGRIWNDQGHRGPEPAGPDRPITWSSRAMTSSPTSDTDPAGPEATAPPKAPMAPIGRLFAAVAFLEAFTWVGLLVGMFLKYVTGTTEAGVWLFGRLHGGTFMVYVGVTIVAAISLRWRWWVTLIALLAAVPPLVTVPMEIWLRRTRRLTRRPRVLPPRPRSSGPPRRRGGPMRRTGQTSRAGRERLTARAGPTGGGDWPGRPAGPARRHRGAAPGRAETRAGLRNGERKSTRLHSSHV